MRHIRKLFTLMLLLTGMLALQACDSNDGPAENAGEAIDEAADAAADRIDDAADATADQAEEVCEDVTGNDCD